jgi:nucleoside-diphosphate-sugar epimerase
MQKNEPTSRRPVAASQRRTVLLTGAAGVVGHALIPRLANADVICLVHRSPVSASGVTTVHGDLRQRRMGLSTTDFANLTQRVDAVIHSAAITDFNRRDGSLQQTNVEGTKHVLDFAATAGVPLYHVSTAYLDTVAYGDRGRTAVGYASSKRQAEEAIHTSGLPHVILRPSVIVGDSRSGEIRSFQGLYKVAGAVLDGVVPLIPFDPAWPIDFIPIDVVADAVATVVDKGLTQGEFWLTSGERALRFDEAVAVCIGIGAQLGRPVGMPRFVAPEVFDRLIAPVFLEELPPNTRRTIVGLLELFAAYLARDTAFPSSIDALVRLGVSPMPDPRSSLRNSLLHWARATGRSGSPLEDAAA